MVTLFLKCLCKMMEKHNMDVIMHKSEQWGCYFNSYNYVSSYHQYRSAEPCQYHWGHEATVLDPGYPTKDRQKTSGSSSL